MTEFIIDYVQMFTLYISEAQDLFSYKFRAACKEYSFNKNFWG